jgi:hypothetical protein
MVMTQMAVPELARARLLDLRGRHGFLGRLHQVDWWAVVVIVLIPTRPDELTFYFPAVLEPRAADDSRRGPVPSWCLVKYEQGNLGCTNEHWPHPRLEADWMTARLLG